MQKAILLRADVKENTLCGHVGNTPPNLLSKSEFRQRHALRMRPLGLVGRPPVLDTPPLVRSIWRSGSAGP